MDRQIVWPGAVPLETDILSTNKDAMIGLSKLAAAVLGTSTLLNGLACTPNSPAALNVLVAPGEIYSMQNIDGTSYSSIAADTTHAIYKQGISLDTVTLSTPAPVTAGFSVNYLIQIAYTDTDTDSVVLPYYNASNPAQAYSGPNNTGVAQPTKRKGVCSITVKTGVAAASGTQTTPAPDAGYTGAYVVTVANGATTVTAGNISVYAGAPFLAMTLPQAVGTNVANIFTQIQKVVTPALGSNDTSVPTTAWVDATLGGILTKSMAGTGNVTLTAIEAGNGIIIATGAQTANNAMIVPVSPTRSWIINNNTTGAFSLTIKTPAGTGVVVPQGANTMVWTDGTNVLSAITVPPKSRVSTIVSSATPTPPADICDIFSVTALAVAATIGAPTAATAALYENQPLVIRIKDDGTARALTWDAAYQPGTNVLPTTTIVGKTHYIGLFYNAVSSKWDVIGVPYTG